jgi:hypothetical protein
MKRRPEQANYTPSYMIGRPRGQQGPDGDTDREHDIAGADDVRAGEPAWLGQDVAEPGQD